MIGLRCLFTLGLSLIVFRLSLSKVLEGEFTIEYDTYFTNSNVQQAWANSIIQCARDCIMTSTCQYAAFNKKTESCRIANDSSYNGRIFVPEWIFMKGIKASEAASESCTDCVGYGSSMYKFVDTPLMMSDAKVICENLGGKLVEVETEPENNFLKGQMFALNNSNGFWMGAYSYTPDSSFVWFSTPNELLTFTEFYPGQPNDPTNEFCLRFYQPFGYSWADIQCTTLYSYVCEFSV